MTIGEGSFSSVYRARQEILDRWVAVKVLHEKDGDRRTELMNEARNQAQMSIACIPGVYDAFVRGQQLFIVMEWIKGASLQTLLENGIAHASDRAALAGSIVAALAGLHRLGFAHRDIKPANILVTPEGGVYLVDFGFSKKVGEGGRSIVGAVKGTPAYMAPEMWQGRGDIDTMRADLFALGKVLRELAPGPGWEDILPPLMAPDPGQRPTSAVELWEQCRDVSQSGVSAECAAAIVQVTSALLSKRLLQAAKLLLFARRRDEAYWLLAECLQEDPDCVEAISLIERIPGLAENKRKLRATLATAAVAVFLLSLSVAYHFGQRLERETRYPSIVADTETEALLLPAHGGRKKPSGGYAAFPATAEFREPAGAGSRLAGILFLEGVEGCDTLSLDAKSLAIPVPSGGIPLEPGEHALDCLDRNGERVYRERLALLPFQRKIIRIRSAKPGKDA
jgi:predicted Ser/Thr protein kinase